MDEKLTDNLKIENSKDIGLVENFNNVTKLNSKRTKVSKKYLFLMIFGVIGIVGGLGCILIGLLNRPDITNDVAFPELDFNKTDNNVYSDLTGEKLARLELKTAPAYCVQTPNGTDGGRPQAGINEAGVVFEAIAEAGITRFAAIYQNPSTAIIGPIRSLRTYYLEWDTPFDCTIVHAGGSGDALLAVSSGGYRDLTEDYTYMYRGTYGSRMWNNLFTTSTNLEKFSADRSYNTSNIKGFKRMTPEESSKARVVGSVKNQLVITKPADGDTSETNPSVTSINLGFGGVSTFNVHYAYNAEDNTYTRSYENGSNHDIYRCSNEDLGERNPEDVCVLDVLSPSVVIAMVVQESRDTDGYHEKITTTGSGDAYIFQNGAAIAGKWNKSSISDQIKFTDIYGNEVALAPGQTFISAIPTYGSVDY